MPWALGTDSGAKAREQTKEFVKSWLLNSKYKTRLPRQHITVLLEGEREPAGVIIRVVSQPDAKPPWQYQENGHGVSEDYHQIALFVKADKKADGAKSVSAVFGVLRAIYANRDGTPERLDLINRGIHMCFETPDGLIVDPEGEQDEGTFFRQQINLRCNTDTFLN